MDDKGFKGEETIEDFLLANSGRYKRLPYFCIIVEERKGFNISDDIVLCCCAF
jgi:hypothetical protein